MSKLFKSSFRYNRNTGFLYWRYRKTSSNAWNAKHANKPAGFIAPVGYIMISFKFKDGTRRMLYAHRIIWCLVKGRWPKKEIDHKNGKKVDNRLSNLREASRVQNCRNTRTRRGYKGVCLDKRDNRWRAYINFNKKRIPLGYHDTLVSARRAYSKAAKRLFGEFANIGA